MNSPVPQPITLSEQVVILEPLSMEHAGALLKAAQNEEIWLYTLDKPVTVEEGILRSRMVRHNGQRFGSIFFSILDNEWPAVKAKLEGALKSSAGGAGDE